jgi:hypothetical protein
VRSSQSSVDRTHRGRVETRRDDATAEPASGIYWGHCTQARAALSSEPQFPLTDGLVALDRRTLDLQSSER